MVAARTPNVTVGPTLLSSASNTSTRKRAARGKTARRGWESRLRPELEPRVVADRRQAGSLLLPTPLVVGETVASIPAGRVMTVTQLRSELARRFDADRTCPLMAGIFLNVLAGVVAEDLGQGKAPRWPIWRVVRDDGALPPKWPLDALYRATVLRQEGIRLTHRHGHWTALDTQRS
jgi:alkylated DNA nucleotide flippase Atl1